MKYKLSDDGIHLEVLCDVCGKYFIPTNMKIRNKIQEIKGKLRCHNLYCSDECKQSNQFVLSSKAELEIQEFISLYNENVICNDRQTILNEKTGYYLELDVYLPYLNKAIEYNGTYWHSLPKAIEHDKIKKEECKRLGINLLVIDEQNYIDDKQKEFSKIKEFLK